MKFIAIAEKALNNFDDFTWDIINGFGQDLIDNVKKNESNSDVVNAHARVLLFMVGKAYGATRYQIRPWNNDRELNKIAEALVFQIKIKNPTTKMYSILESLQDKFKYRKIYHDSWLSKVGHVLWPEACPVYDSRATFTLGKIGKYIGSDLPHSINGWRDDDCTWDKYINYMYTVLIIFKKNYNKIVNFHELDKLLWYYGSKECIKPLLNVVQKLTR